MRRRRRATSRAIERKPVAFSPFIPVRRYFRWRMKLPLASANIGVIEGFTFVSCVPVVSATRNR